MLQGIKCYNSDNILILVSNVSVQAKEVGYDLEANLTLLKLNQFNNELQNITYVEQILLKAVTNLRHSDRIICKSLLSQEVLNDLDLSQVEENIKIKKSRRKLTTNQSPEF
jgi:translation initiation factor 3 subunit K